MGTISDPVPNPYKDITEFAARQVSESRQMFERFYKLTFGSIAIVAALITGGFYFLVGREYRDIESKVQATVGKKTDEEIARLQQEVRARIEAEFKTENLHRLVREVAAEQTKAGIQDVITRVVVERVQARIEAEQPQIHDTVIQETKKAVAGLSPTLEGEVQKLASQAENRIGARIGKWEEVIKAGNLSIMARNGLGTAYDELLKLGATTTNSDISTIAVTTRNQLYLEMNQSMYETRNFTVKKTRQELTALLGDPQPLTRKAAIDDIVSTGEKSVVPKLLDMAEHDPFIIVRHAAYHGLQTLTGQHIDALQVDDWKAWWKANEGTWPKQ